jgi:hypothetical protein
METYPTAGAAPNLLDREIDLLRGGIAMVASGGTRRMTIAGIRFGEDIIRICLPLAQSAGVTLEPVWRTDDSGCDVRVERPHLA